MVARAVLWRSVAVLCLVGLPAVAAQGPGGLEIDVEFEEPFPGPIRPETQLWHVEATIILRIPAGHACTKPLGVQMDLAGPAYASPLVNPQTHSFVVSEAGLPMTSAEGTEQRIRTNLFVTTTRAAPAFEAGEYTLTVSVSPQDGDGCTLSRGSMSMPLLLPNDYFASVEVLPQRTLLRAFPGERALFPITVSNLGNGAARISSEATQPSDDRLDAVVPPPPFPLESKLTQGEAATEEMTIFVVARAPDASGYTNSGYRFQFDFLAQYLGPEPASDEDRTSVFLTLHVQGGGAGNAPAPGLVAVALAAVGEFAWRARLGKVDS